ncbi:MAG: ABC transporter ATP-binding protein [Clostridiaceae bacterium]|jgi:peptide/nickel transport system ATP-binding protein|nr:ABC transporter ATP-binding protein [Bacillota bacterium]NLN51558.1 ABC transporter ATP-binding protein [Clostridiaceae bacterium]
MTKNNDKSKDVQYLTIKEEREIARSNRKIMKQFEKAQNRKNVDESEFTTTMRDPRNVIEIDNLHTYFYTDVGTTKAVNGVSFDIPEGKIVGVVGESGCGKSVTSLSVMQLVQGPAGQIVDGSIRYATSDGKCYDVAKMPRDEMRRIRGQEIAMIFQEPMTSLNPVFRIGEQLDEALAIFEPDMSKNEVKARTIEMLQMVGIADQEKIYDNYPHELSGGMRQRVMIAMALICNPRLIIADEPTTALDVTIQAQILDLLLEIKNKINGSIMLITHDLGVIAGMADYVVVMYAGKIVEAGDIHDIFKNPKHPYTVGLMRSLPSLSQVETGSRLNSIPGQVPSPVNLPDNCYFCNRCEYSFDICTKEYPSDYYFEDGHRAACFLYDEKYQDLGLEKPELPKKLEGSSAKVARIIPRGRVELKSDSTGTEV